MKTMHAVLAPMALAMFVTRMANGAAPAVTASAASNIRPNAAVFNGTLTAGTTANITVYWGTSPDDLWCAANLGSIPEGAFAHTETTLLSATTYYYRFHAINPDGEAWSSIVSFTTTAVAPNPRYGGGWYGGYASAATAVNIPPAASIIFLR